MASLIPDFEYDIFISYRHNDNLPSSDSGRQASDGWVTNFVESLEKELRGTLKESLTIYFDKNPHDGLLETHNVDKSLEGKLKCLIFIPIISQTYCDPKSFAWQNEFVAFNKLVQEDSLGRDVLLNNGNVASRILPVKIHELDAEDIATIEKETGGVLRAIEFIYKEPGVNRPLKVTDERSNNQNQTDYGNQVNKVANAIKEIVASIKPSTKTLTTKIEDKIIRPTKNTRKLGAIISVIVFIIALAVYFIYPKVNRATAPAEIEKSIAVLPFVNMSNDSDQEYFSDGISEEILNLLAKVPDLKVIGRTSSFYFKGKNEDLRVIGEKLGVALLLEGSVRKDGNKVRITAQLIRAKDGTHLWSETYDRELDHIFQLQDEIAGKVLTQLKLKLLVSSTSKSPMTKEVHNLMLQGNYYYDRQSPEDLDKSISFYEQAISLDSSNAKIWASLATATFTATLGQPEQYSKVLVFVNRAIALDVNSPEAHRVMGLTFYFYDFNVTAAEKEFKRAHELDPNNSNVIRNLGSIMFITGRYKDALTYYKKALEGNPLSVNNVNNLGDIYVFFKDYDKAITIYNSGNELWPERSNRNLAYAYLLAGETQIASAYIERQLPNASDKIELSIMLHYTLGNPKEMNSEIDKLILLNDRVNMPLARAYSFIHQKDKAFYYFERALQEREIPWNGRSTFLLDRLRDDPRYEELWKRYIK